MVSTYKLFKQILLEKYKNQTTEQLCQLYKETENPSILAQVFCNNVGMLSNICYSPYFSSLDNSDKVSALTQCLHKAMLKYKPDSGNKFLAYAGAVIKNAFLGEIKKQKISVRPVIYSLQEMAENNPKGYEAFENNIHRTNTYEYDIALTKSYINNSSLTEKEKAMCCLIIEFPNETESELAARLKVHRLTVRNMKQRLRIKLAWLKN